MTTLEIIANVLSFMGNALFTSTSLLKNKKLIITFQCINSVLSATAAFIQSAFSGMVQDVVLLIKNIVLLFVKEEKRTLRLVINILCIILGCVGGVVINIIFNDNAWFGYLPVIGIFFLSTSSTYVFLKENLSKNKEELIIKSGLIINGALWVVYGFIVKLYPITIFNSLTIVLSTIAIIRIIIKIRGNESEGI